MLDATAWIQLFQNMPSAKKVETLMQRHGQRFTTLINFYEVLLWYQRRDPKKMDPIAAQIKNKSQLVNLNETVVYKAWKLKQNHNQLSMADALSLATARQLDAALVTADKDFDKMDNVIILQNG